MAKYWKKQSDHLVTLVVTHTRIAFLVKTEERDQNEQKERWKRIRWLRDGMKEQETESSFKLVGKKSTFRWLTFPCFEHARAQCLFVLLYPHCLFLNSFVFLYLPSFASSSLSLSLSLSLFTLLLCLFSKFHYSPKNLTISLMDISVPYCSPS